MLSVIIVSYNTKEKLKNNLEALFKSEGVDFEVFVVDNNSKDGSVEMLKENFPQVKLIANKENFGFARANNQAIKQAKGDMILLLNPDMKVFSDTLKKQVDFAKQNEKAWVSGCKLVDKNNNIVRQVRNFPKFFDQAMIILKIPHIFPFVLNSYIVKNFDYSKSAKVDSLRGSFFMIKKIALEKVGLLDENFFIWFEEVDYCKRVYQSGGEVWYNADNKAIDYVGQSFAKVKRNKKQKYFRDSMIYFFEKWGKPYEVFLLKFFWKMVLLVF